MALPHGAVVGMQCVIMIFSGHTHLFFFYAVRMHFIGFVKRRAKQHKSIHFL